MDGDFGCWQMVCFASLWNLEDAQAKQGALYRLESITTHPKRNVNITSWLELVDILKEAENVTGRRLFLGMPSFSMLSFRIGCWFSNKVSWLAKPARLAWSFTSTGWLDSPAIFFHGRTAYGHAVIVRLLSLIPPLQVFVLYFWFLNCSFFELANHCY